MATILLAAAGAALGSGFGGTVLGLSGAVIGRAIGATLGKVIDQRLLGSGSDAVDVGRIDRFRVMGASEGTGVAQVYGRVRLAGQVIWATRFQETAATSGGGKGAPQPEVTEYSYSVSLAIALCEGQILSVGRIWADGEEIAPKSIQMRVYRGGDAQQPDAKIEAVEGAGRAPAYRGIAYVVIEDLALGAFGNRVPQFSFEVFRAAPVAEDVAVAGLQEAVRGVAVIPGTGEYTLATTPVHFSDDPGVNRAANVNTRSGGTDFEVALAQLDAELPNCQSVSLVVSWFGDDLRCGACEIRPKVEQNAQDGEGMAWQAGGITRSSAQEVPKSGGNPVYGGTPADAAVIEAIQALRQAGKSVMFYPFILMEQLAANGKPDPWSGAADQPVLPWRGRITTARAAGQAGSSDRSAAAADEVADFFGTAQPGDFSVVAGQITYSGPAEWRYRRFILHYANLCAQAGGVDAFCIGSEMVGLTQIRGAGDSFPAVTRLRQLAQDVRAILGPDTKLGYAADWSEYFGCHRDGNVYFHLDPLWSDPAIDFIGIDNYMPLSDWRDGDDHADAGRGPIHDLAYLKSNIAGGEGYDWYYDSDESRAGQRRRPIEDGAFGEPWVFRYKDIRNWWGELHHNRQGAVRSVSPTAWVPGSKPIWFTEYGCPAMDKGTNQPNKFIDAKSSESQRPYGSDGRRDDLIQMQYLRAFSEYWGDPAANPTSPIYGGPMVDMSRAHVWTWDARPYPVFPNADDIWSDGGNHPRGHWLTGRATNQSLSAVVAAICTRAGLTAFDVSGLYGIVRGFWREDAETARQALQPLMLAYGFDAAERDGRIVFSMRDRRSQRVLARDTMAVADDLDGPQEAGRAAEAEMAGRVRVGFVGADGDYEWRQAQAIFPDDVSLGVSLTELPLVFTRVEARGIAERWLTESRVARDTTRFALPPSMRDIGAGDMVNVGGLDYRIDRVDLREYQTLDAVRVEPAVYQAGDGIDLLVKPRRYLAPLPTHALFLDLPLLTGEEVPHAPHLAVSARPWPGVVACWSAIGEADFSLNSRIEAASVMGRTQTILASARAGLWDRGPSLRVRLFSGALSSASELAVLNGANVMAIGDGSTDRWEVFQFQEAVLVAPQVYELRLRLRGQQGSDGLMPPVWPVGSDVVLLNATPRQIRLGPQARGLARSYRVGIAARGFNDRSVVKTELAFQGNGLRPYAPVHLRVSGVAGGQIFTWVRRTRVEGDGWSGTEVPLGEVTQSYSVRVTQNGTVLREATVDSPAWTYTNAQRTADGITGGYTFEVAQISESFGPGLSRAMQVPV